MCMYLRTFKAGAGGGGVVSHLSAHQNPLPGGLVKPEQWALHPELVIPLVWDGAKESEFLTSS